ncbi:MAG: Gfo/Idh/MocA family oxidoreductase [Candidatus Micrarchaeota archaeon]|nr:Gfo/Idh/MocA family oxidoreductase [Candidatus Micrarchaeota archaeon]
MLTKKINVGIIGCGSVARKRHIPSYNLDRRCKIIAVLSPDIEQAKEVAKKFNIPKYYNNLDDFLSEKLDVVSICTPPLTHSELAISCIKQGCHVLVEKPMAMNTSEALRMLHESVKEGVKFCVVHNLIFSYSIQTIDKMYRAGKLGKVGSIWGIQISNLKRELPRWYPSLPCGLFFDESPHMLYLFKHFLPSIKVERVNVDNRQILMQKPKKIEVYFAGDDYTSSVLLIDFNCARDEWLIYMIFERAFIKVDLFRDTVIILGKAGTHTPSDVLKGSFSELFQEVTQLLRAGLRFSIKRQLYGHDKLIRLFIDSIVENGAPPIMPEDAVAVTKMQEDIIKKIKDLTGDPMC